MKKNLGFTLIELMVTVAIIAFLTSVGIAIYADVQTKGRNAKRQTDIDAIAKAIEIHRADNGQYQPLNVDWFGSSGGLPLADPKGYHYCIKSNSDGTAITNATSGSSGNWGTDKNCTGYSNIIAGAPTAGYTTWKICTLLDNGTDVYCRYNVQ